uniref:glutathione-specific gamma-glutamylcyclotransferase n=1 Tax=Candidozyma auris TaxID=498019 RepID=A0A0L0NPN1_CANAR
MSGMWVIGYGLLIFKPPPLYQYRVTGTLKGYIRRFWQSSSDHRGTPESPGRVVTLMSLKDLKSHSRFHNDLCTYELNPKLGESNVATDSVADLPASALANDIHDVQHKIDTLQEDDLKVWGVAYYVAPEHVDEMKAYLDVREQDGYTLHKVKFHVHSIPEDAKRIMREIPRDEAGDLFIELFIYIGTIDNESFVGPESVEDTAAIIKSSHGPSGPNFEYLNELTKAVRALDPDCRSRDFYLEDLVALATP